MTFWKRLFTFVLLSIALAHPAAAGGTFIYANNSPYDTIDPHMTFNVARAAPRINFYDGLYRWVDNPPKLIPWLAESYTVSDDGLTWTFKLRDGVKFHDGTELTSDDVVYSLQRLIALKGGASGLFIPLIDPTGLKALSKDRVQFRLRQPSAIFLATTSELLVVNSKLVRGHEVNSDWGAKWLAGHEAGSGSFALDRYDPAIGFTAKRFADHFMGWGPKFLDGIEFRTVLDNNTRVLGMIKGDFQGTDGYLPYDQVRRLRAAPSVAIHEEQSMRLFYIAIDNGRPPMNDLHFRKALSYAFDYNGFITDILKGTVARNPSPIPNNLWGAPANLPGYTYDLDKAKAELAQVKEPLRPITIGAVVGLPETGQAAALFQSSLRQIGIDSKIKSAPWSVVAAKISNKDQMYDLLPIWKSTYYVDPNNWIGELYNSRYIGDRNISWYSNPQVDKLLDQALVDRNQDDRRGLYEKAAKLVVDDAAGIFVFNPKWYGPYAKSVGGVRFSPSTNGQDMRWLYFN